MKTFVINLKRRQDRIDNFFEKCPLPKESIEVIYGFDAKSPELENKKEQHIFKNKLKNLGTRLNRLGERGVFISHLRIWKKIVNENISQALIFEDDALFSSLFNLNNIKLDIQFNLLFLGGRFQPNFMMTPQTSAKVADNIVVHNYTYWDPTFHDRTAHAYIITFEFAKFLIELFNIINKPLIYII